MGVPFPQKYGGADAGEIGYCTLMEELNRVCPSAATFLGAHIGIGAMAIYLDGTEAQKQKYLVPLVRGEKIAAFGLTEPNAGSDAASIRTKATLEGDSYFLDGSKIYITNGPIADIVTTMAVTDPSLEAAVKWAKSRRQFGQAIAHQQSIQWMIAEMQAEIEALRSLVYRTAWLMDSGRPFTKEAACCKLLGSEVASRCVDRALQIHGGFGLSRDFPLERAYRDARIAEIFEGTNEIQRIVIASEVMQKVGVRLRP